MAKVRVMAVLPAEGGLRASAEAFSLGRISGLDEVPSALPEGIDVDPAFAAVPLASLGGSGLIAQMTPGLAPRFVVRGSVEEERIEEIGKAGIAALGEAEIFVDPRISTTASFAPKPKAPGCTMEATGAVADVAAKLDVAALTARGLTGKGVAIAVMDTGINLPHLRGHGMTPLLDNALTWSPSGGAPGAYPVNHGSMCAFDALIAAPQATLLDFPIMLSTASGASGMDGLLSDALQAYAGMLAAIRLPARQRRFRALVVTNSWAMYHPSWDFPPGHPGRYADNPSHPFNIMVGTLARAGADILFAAGNCGPHCPDGRCQGMSRDTINGANAHPDVLTIAGVTVRDQWVGYSSQGPGIAGMAHAKPDLACYTHFMGSEALGPGHPDLGTSAACPVAAGAIAALRTRLPVARLGPKALARELRTDAVNLHMGGRGWNRDCGHGIIRPALTAARLGL